MIKIHIGEVWRYANDDYKIISINEKSGICDLIDIKYIKSKNNRTFVIRNYELFKFESHRWAMIKESHINLNNKINYKFLND